MTWNNLSFTDVSNNSTWALVNAVALPATAEEVSDLRFRWTATVASSSGYRIDDVLVTGVPPTITVSAAALAAFTTTQGTASATQTYTVSGSTLKGTNGIVVTPPTGYEIGQGATPTYSTSAITVAQTSAKTVAATTISVRLTAAATAASSPYDGSITHTSPGATQVDKAVTGTVTSPTITVSPTPLCGFSYVEGSGPSASQSFNVSGNSLTGAPGNLSVASSTSYEVSSDNVTFGSTASVAYSAATLAATPVYVRLKAGLLANTYNGETIAISGGGATTKNVTVNGTVLTASGAAIGAATVATVPVCASAGAPVTVTYSLSGTFDPANTFTAQLSDASGVFSATPTVIGSVVSATATSISATIPANTASGTGYMVRVVADNGGSPVTGSPSAAFTIVSNPTVAIAPAAAQTIVRGANGTTLTATEAPSTGTSRVWQFAATSGGPYTTISGQTGLTYTPNFAAAGVYYVVATTTFAACGSVTSNEVMVAVNNPAPTITSVNPASGNISTAVPSLQITGANFISGVTTVTFDGTTYVPTSITATVITLSIPVSAVATSGPKTIEVTNPNGGGMATGTYTVNAAPTISTTTVAPVSVYPGASVTVSYATTGTFNTGNVFTAELSTVTGTFPGTALTATASSAGSITATIPAGTAGGTAYTIRVKASDPATTGPASNTFEVKAAVFEPFELTSIGSSYLATPTDVTFQSGTWKIFQAANGSSASGEAFNGVRSIRIRGGGYVQYAKANGVGTVSLYAARFGSDASLDASFTLQYSIDGGTTFLVVPGTVAANALPVNGPTHSFTTGPYTYTLNVSGPVIIRIGTTNTTVGSNPRINVDDVTITDYNNVAPVLSASPNALSVTALAGQTSTVSYTLVGQNLPTGTTASISSADPSILISTDGGLTYAATATSAAANASGNLSQVVSVQFTAPATSGTTVFTIANDIAGLNLSAPVTISATAVPLVTYTWTGAASTSWSDPANWSPNRTTPDVNDVMIFNGSTAYTVVTDFTSLQTIGQLRVTGTPSVTFSNTGDRVLTINNLVSGADMVLAAGAKLTVFNPSTSTTATGLTIQLNSGANAAISGTLVFDAATATTSGTGAHRLLGSGPNSVEFLNGSYYKSGLNANGSPFGTTAALNGTVVFRNGSTAEQAGGGQLFGTSTAITLEPNSLYIFSIPTDFSTPPLSNRTYGNLEFKVGDGIHSASTAASPVTIAGNLTITSGIIGLNLTGGVILKGDVLVNGSSTLSFSPSSAASVQFIGTTLQTIGGTAPASALTFGANESVTINNAVGVSLQYSIALQKTLALTNGVLFLNGNTLTLNGPLTATATGLLAGSATAGLVLGGAGALAPLSTTPGAGSTFGVLTLNRTDAGTLTFNNSVTLNSLNLTKGTLAIGANNTLTLNGPVASATTGFLQGSATSSLSFTGPSTTTGDLTFATGTETLQNLTLNQAANTLIPVGSTLTIGTLTLTQGSLLFSGTNRGIVSTLSGGNANSFVNALTLTSEASATPAVLVYPLGHTIGRYRLLTLAATQTTPTATSYTARILTGNGNDRSVTPPLTRVSKHRYYSVMEENTTNFLTGALTLSFGPDDHVTNTSTLRIARSVAGAPYADVAPTNSSTPAITGTATNGTITDVVSTLLGDFALATTATDLTENPLPVVLTSFGAQRQAAGVVAASWTTASEQNSASFDVQRSLDGRTFVTVASVTARGTSTQNTTYAAQDNTAPAATIYYRLRQVDTDGKAVFSQVVTVAGTTLVAGTTELTLYPNPTTDRITAALPAADGRTYRVLNALGQVVSHGTAEATNPTVEVRQLPAGLYFLELHTAAGLQVRRFVKNN